MINIQTTLEIKSDVLWQPLTYFLKGKPATTLVRPSGKISFFEFCGNQVIKIAEKKAVPFMKNIVKRGMPGGTGQTLSAIRVIDVDKSKRGDLWSWTIGLIDNRIAKGVMRVPKRGLKFYWQVQEFGHKPYIFNEKQRKWFFANIDKSKSRIKPSPEYRMAGTWAKYRKPKIRKKEQRDMIHPGIVAKQFMFGGMIQAERNISFQMGSWIERYLSYCLPFYKIEKWIVDKYGIKKG